MKTSARNTFSGKVSSLKAGAINDEIIVAAGDGVEVVAVITKSSTEKLGLAIGKEVTAIVKASNVTLMTDAEDYILSTRNKFDGVVKSITSGMVNAEVVLEIGNNLEITATVTMTSLKKLGLQEGSKASAVVKALSVLLAVKK